MSRAGLFCGVTFSQSLFRLSFALLQHSSSSLVCPFLMIFERSYPHLAPRGTEWRAFRPHTHTHNHTFSGLFQMLGVPTICERSCPGRAPHGTEKMRDLPVAREVEVALPVDWTGRRGHEFEARAEVFGACGLAFHVVRIYLPAGAHFINRQAS